MNEQNQQTYVDSRPGLLSTALKWLSIPVTALSGYFFAATHVHNAAYDRASRHGLIGRTVMDKGKAQPTLTLPKVDAVEEEFGVARKTFKKTGTVNLTERIPQLDKVAAEEISQGMKKLGLGTIFRQWKFIHISDKQEALMKGITASGIALGAIFAVANNKTVANALAKKENKNNENQVS